ncbi:LysR family transcriptional regulator [Undibacterium umbellatum]|uniref:LysR family transcriptional regulator n=1 Tax=Undibacterium umbellatum TaxID=2762300 RepID=A0ABR6ZJQ7_9BURK|nr:LysR family transcriptional regulator [Undibacterium umbellatum]MBC3911492.1 LysR family transcriptional regulator [Undibacterium umbellatum]
MMNWDDLRYFLALVDSGTLTGAARRLQVEHTTVARRIDALEVALGLRLFDRLVRGWQLTTEGRDLVAHAREVEERWFSFERKALQTGKMEGVVRISAPPTLSTFVLAPNLKKICTSLADIELELQAERHHVSLGKREADIALRMTRPQTAGLVIKPLASVGYGLYASKSYLKKHAAGDWEFIAYEKNSPTPHHQWLENYLGQRKVNLRSNDQMVMAQCAAAGVGVTVLPHYLHQIHRDLYRIEQDASIVQRKLWLVMHDDVRRSPRVRAVADQLIELFANEAIQNLLN